MAYTHEKKRPVFFKNDPADSNGTDWYYCSIGDWLRPGESVSVYSGIVSNGVMDTDSTYLGTMLDSEGVSYDEVYGIQATPGASGQMTVTWRFTTTTTGSVDLGRVDMDFSAVVPIIEL